LLWVLAVAALVAAVAAGRSTQQSIATGRSPMVLTTPILSARRVPDLVTRGISAKKVQDAVAPLLATEHGSVCFTATADGTPLMDDNGAQPMMPGSNMKLATAFTALRVLGADTTLTTEVDAAAKPDATGTVAGNVWFVGGGDPIIDTADYVQAGHYGPPPHTALESIADQVVAAGVHHITGGIVGDDTRYDEVRQVPSWPTRYLTERQIGPISALAVDDTLEKLPSAVAGAGPAVSAATMLTVLLRARGVVIDGAPAAGQVPLLRTTLVTVASLPIRQIIGEMLAFSDNNTAESILKEIGHKASGTGSSQAGAAVVAGTLRAAGLSVAGFSSVDGSGLDRSDRTSCDLLQAILVADGTGGAIYAGLAQPGQNGTLRGRFGGIPAARTQVRAKTGTLKDVTALSGWVHTNHGNDVAFSFLLNTGGRAVGASDLRLEEQLAAALFTYPDTPDPATVSPTPARAG